MEIKNHRTSTDELPWFHKLVQANHQGLCRQSIADATTDTAQRRKIHMEQEEAFERIKKELWEAPVRGMPTKNVCTY